MAMIRHHNYQDENGEVYCCLRNRVVKLDDDQRTRFCQGCKMFAGDLQGQGVSCEWDDLRDVDDPHVVLEPWLEFRHNQVKQVPPEAVSTNLEDGN